MIDVIPALSLLFSILILACFFLLLIIQINSYNSKKIENQFFIIAIVAGTIAIISYIFDTVLWIKQPNFETRRTLDSILFFFFTICFYFWYKHYSEIIFLKGKEKRKYNYLQLLQPYLNWLEPIDLIDILFFIGIIADIVVYFGYYFNLDSLFNPLWYLFALDNVHDRYVTFLSHIAFLSGLVFFYISFIIVANNLIELNKVSILELFAIVPLGFSNFFLFFNDVFVTYGIYSPDLALFLVNIGLLIIFISLIILLVNYIVVNPSHIQSPSLYKDIVELFKTIDDPSFQKEKILEVSAKPDFPIEAQKSLNLEIPHKLNGTCIIILIYLMKNSKLNTLAKDLEVDLSLNKSTISYNLKILEKNEFISRSSPLELKGKSIFSSDKELDQRQKFISINENGKEFLVMLHDYLGSIFQTEF